MGRAVAHVDVEVVCGVHKARMSYFEDRDLWQCTESAAGGQQCPVSMPGWEADQLGQGPIQVGTS
jgi:hypothetical protein